MGTTILGVFDSQDYARQAITELRERLQNQNVAIIMRENQAETAGSQDDWNLTRTWSDLARDTVEMAQSSGELAGRVMGATLTSMFAFPAMLAAAFAPVTTPRSYTSRQERESKIMVTVQGTDSVGEALDIMKRYGAREINTYSN